MDTSQSESYKFKEIVANSNFGIVQKAYHVTHLLNLFDTMCKYEMDPASIMEDTEHDYFHRFTLSVRPLSVRPSVDRRTDDGQTWNQYTK